MPGGTVGGGYPGRPGDPDHPGVFEIEDVDAGLDRSKIDVGKNPSSLENELQQVREKIRGFGIEIPPELRRLIVEEAELERGLAAQSGK